MKITQFTVLAVGITAMSFSAITYAGGWQPASKVLAYSIEGGPTAERVYVKFDMTHNPDACKDPWQMVRLDASNDRGKLIFASLVNAKKTTQSVKPWVDGCDESGAPLLVGIFVL